MAGSRSSVEAIKYVAGTNRGNLYRLTGTRWRRMESVGSAESWCDRCMHAGLRQLNQEPTFAKTVVMAPGKGLGEGVYFQRQCVVQSEDVFRTRLYE